MSASDYTWEELLAHAGIEDLPEGLDELYDEYEDEGQDRLISPAFLDSLFRRFDVPVQEQQRMLAALEKVEEDARLLALSKFFVHDMCSERNRRDGENYTAMNPAPMGEWAGYYSFLLLLACVEPSRKMLAARGVPEGTYIDTPYGPMARQFQKLVEEQNPEVGDFGWDLKFYKAAIFRFDRFLFIPEEFGENFVMIRDLDRGQVLALRLAGETFRRDGQYDGINGVFDESGRFETNWDEDHHFIRANVSSPMGFVKRDPVEFHIHDLQLELEAGDNILAIHIPAGPGYTPERLQKSMEQALEFFGHYFPELDLKGFWSESWFFDPKLSLLLDEETSNIVRVQRHVYLHPLEAGDEMLRYEVFGDWEADPLTLEAETSLQRAIQDYMRSGGRFNLTGMVVLRDDVPKMLESPYASDEDRKEFRSLVSNCLPGRE